MCFNDQIMKNYRQNLHIELHPQTFQRGNPKQGCHRQKREGNKAYHVKISVFG